LEKTGHPALDGAVTYGGVLKELTKNLDLSWVCLKMGYTVFSAHFMAILTGR